MSELKPRTAKDQRFIDAVKELINDKVIKSVRQFLLSIGAHKSLFHKIENGLQSVQDEIINAAVGLYPKYFDRVYIYTGLGKQFVEESKMREQVKDWVLQTSPHLASDEDLDDVIDTMLERIVERKDLKHKFNLNPSEITGAKPLDLGSIPGEATQELDNFHSGSTGSIPVQTTTGAVQTGLEPGKANSVSQARTGSIPVPVPETIPERFKLFRDHLSLTQEELAEKAGVSRNVITKIENDKQGVSEELLIKLAKLFGLNLNWLLAEQGEMIGLSDEDYKEAEVEKAKEHLPFIKFSEAVDQLIAFDENYHEAMYNSSYHTIQRVPYATYENAFVFEVKGDGMFPSLRDNSLVVGRSLNPKLRRFAIGTHAILTRHRTFLIRRIIKNDGEAITVKADNEKLQEELTIPLSDIRAMFKIGEIVYAPAE